MNPIKLKPSKSFAFHFRGKLRTFLGPQVMGVLNATPDSFYAGSRMNGVNEALIQAERMVNEGAVILDIGAYSSRPGASDITVKEELKRLLPIVEKISDQFPDVPVSVDTFRSEVARASLEAGASIVNDISAGDDDEDMMKLVAEKNVPYILMHKKGVPATMQDHPQYDDVTQEVFDYLKNKIDQCRDRGITNLFIDPGFGFGKTNVHNFTLLNDLGRFSELEVPLLIGVSRKSMIYKTLGITSQEALNGTTVLNTIALMKGANVLRVHDVKEAVEAVRLFNETWGVGLENV